MGQGVSLLSLQSLSSRVQVHRSDEDLVDHVVGAAVQHASSHRKLCVRVSLPLCQVSVVYSVVYRG